MPDSQRLTPAEQQVIACARAYVRAHEVPGISSQRQYNDLVRAVAAEGREKDEEKRGAA